jgi:predicted anti-sigma-YlaC factor YlaD
MLTCKQLDEFLVDFLDGKLGFRQRLSMHMHLGLCRDCRDFLEEYRAASKLGRKVFTSDEQLEAVPEPLIQAVLANLAKGADTPAGDDPAR